MKANQRSSLVVRHGLSLAVVTEAPKTFKATKANWKKHGESPAPVVDDTKREALSEEEEEDQKPVIAGTTRSPTPPPPPPVQKKKGGLLTAAQVREEAQLLAAEERRRDQERARERAEAQRLVGGQEEDDDHSGQDDRPEHQQTVYRDRSGKIVDIEAEKRDQAAKERAHAAKEAAKKDWTRGFTQRAEQQRLAAEEASMSSSTFARSAQDTSMNQALREEQRWNDPAAAFLSSTSLKKRKTGPRRAKYTGPAPPSNRFGILPGFRWDGVDRSTGFETKLFQKINDRKRFQYEAHQWGTEDM